MNFQMKNFQFKPTLNAFFKVQPSDQHLKKQTNMPTTNNIHVNINHRVTLPKRSLNHDRQHHRLENNNYSRKNRTTTTQEWQKGSGCDRWSFTNRLHVRNRDSEQLPPLLTSQWQCLSDNTPLWILSNFLNDDDDVYSSSCHRKHCLFTFFFIIQLH